jgi:glucose-6-phosphate dehydrogenase assembly protein OpcA
MPAVGVQSKPRRMVAMACAVGYLAAAADAGVGLLGLSALVTPTQLRTVTFSGLAVGAVLFVGFLISRFRAGDVRGSVRSIRVGGPYGYLAAAGILAGLSVAVLMISTGHTGKTQECGSGYCRYVSGTLQSISATQFVQDQAGGSLFLACWTFAISSVALAAVNGKISSKH